VSECSVCHGTGTTGLISSSGTPQGCGLCHGTGQVETIGNGLGGTRPVPVVLVQIASTGAVILALDQRGRLWALALPLHTGATPRWDLIPAPNEPEAT
jgi:hypothetical protein